MRLWKPSTPRLIALGLNRPYPAIQPQMRQLALHTMTRSDLPKKGFMARIRNLPVWDILVFSDGSKQKDGSAGASASVYQKNRLLAEVQVPLGPDHEVYDAEVIGALAGLKAAVAAPTTQLATNIHVITDNQGAADGLLGKHRSKSSQDEVIEFRKIAAKWPSRVVSSTASPGSVQVMWSPGHIGIPGNEKADKLARKAARQNCPPSTSLT